jgi:hypothetical protein
MMRGICPGRRGKNQGILKGQEVDLMRGFVLRNERQQERQVVGKL